MQSLIRRIKSNAILRDIVGILKKNFMFVVNKSIGINEKKIVFVSFNGKSYSDNPRAISEKLHEMNPDFQIVWLFNNPNKKREITPNYVKCVKNGSLKAIIELATSKFWVDNFNKPLNIYKSKKQIYIQTWHGDRGFKKVLYDSPYISCNTKYIENEICDLVLSGSDFMDREYKTAFKYTGEILKTGCPRNDILIENNPKKVLAIKDKLKIDKNIKIFLYAPTLRRNAASKNSLQKINEINLIETIKKLEEKTKNDWVCLVRAHSAVKGLSGIPNDNSKIIDVTAYEEMSELLLISDLLITDYSSCAGDFVLLNRPVILFQSDREDYLKYDRTFYFNPDDSPFIIVQSQMELFKIIDELDWSIIPKNCKDILDFYGTKETGEASKYVVKYIINKSRN